MEQRNTDSVEGVGSQPETPRRVSRRTAILAAGGAGVVVLLGGAAYVAGQLLNNNQPRQEGGGGGELAIMTGSGGGGQQKMYKMPAIKPAPEMPANEPDVMGLYLRREDNSLFLGTGGIQVAIQKDATGEGKASAKNSGPTVEVVVTRDTQLFRDKTPITQKDLEAGEPIQQVVERVDSLDTFVEDIGDTDTLQAWGQKNGDRYVATVLLHRAPMMPALGPG